MFTGKVEADLSDDVTASCYDRQITTHVLSCIIFYKICLPIKMLWNARTKECTAVSSVTRINDCLDSPVSLIPSGLYTNTSHSYTGYLQMSEWVSVRVWLRETTCKPSTATLARRRLGLVPPKYNQPCV